MHNDAPAPAPAPVPAVPECVSVPAPRVTLRLLQRRDKRALHSILAAGADGAGQPYLITEAYADMILLNSRRRRRGQLTNPVFVVESPPGIVAGTDTVADAVAGTVAGIVMLIAPSTMLSTSGPSALTRESVQRLLEQLAKTGIVLDDASAFAVGWFTHEAMRRKGVMRAAMRLALDKVRAANRRHVFALVSPHNAASAALARSLGFVRVGDALPCCPGFIRADVADVWLVAL